ncbi:MAG: hypothetical protein JW771_00295, partial [Candidatus Thermoplasmatota archaeon]|nr:hypothetical protein [Candidatus Thermoplasmatota archaeon]
KMNCWGGTSIAAVILLISFLLIGATVASVISSGTEPGSEEEIEELLDDVLNELTTYLQIKDKIGKFSTLNDQLQIQQIALLISPLFSQDIDVTGLTIKLCDGDAVYILNYSGQAAFVGSHGLFGHPLWNSLNETSFGFLAIHDTDRSLIDFDVLNKDLVYTLIKLPEELSLKKGETIEITLFPSSGIVRTIALKAPLPIHSVVTFD